MSSRPLVSVVTTTYRRTRYLEEALSSAVRQTCEDLEVIVSDDGDGEGAEEDVRAIVSRVGDSRIRYRRNGRRLGVAMNTLAASREARGRYVAYLNDDDSWEPEFLATLLPHIEDQPELSVVFADHSIMTGDGSVDPRLSDLSTRRFGRDRLQPGVHRPFERLALVDRSVPIVMSALVRRSAIDWDDFPSEIGPAYDLWLAYLACRTGLGAHYEPRRLTRYRAHQQAQTQAARVAHGQGIAYCYRRFLEDPRLGALRKELTVRHTEALASHSAALIRREPGARARRAALAALRANPSPEAGAAYLLSLMPGRLSRPAINSALVGRRVVRRLRHRD
ncbi:MAG: glycosyltransferase family 2 protein [Candidatus Dormibacteraeota bacterium]|nr:glycosyltransferase family 2 protein [Candidatus Dormibacteraeota bacterium]